MMNRAEIDLWAVVLVDPGAGIYKQLDEFRETAQDVMNMLPEGTTLAKDYPGVLAHLVTHDRFLTMLIAALEEAYGGVLPTGIHKFPWFPREFPTGPRHEY